MAQQKPQRKNIIGTRVRSLRTAAGLSSEDLAAVVATNGGGLSATEIGRIEAGERRVLDDEVLHLAQALGVPVDGLFPKRGSGRRK